MSKLRCFISVDFLEFEQAKNALVAVQSKFFSTTPNSSNFNRVEGNRVYVVKTGDTFFDNKVKEFLFSQKGISPVGYSFN